MKAMFWLRMLAWVKRGVLALERLATAQETLAEAAVAATRPMKRPKMAEITIPSIREMNERWQEQRDHEVYGEEID